MHAPTRPDAIEGLNDLILEFWTLGASQLLYSPANDTAATYTLSSIEILSEYINSPSLANYFRANPMSFPCHDYAWRYQTITDQTSQIRLSTTVAPFCTSTSWPWCTSSSTDDGMRPTRYSWFLISLGTPIRMSWISQWGWASAVPTFCGAGVWTKDCAFCREFC